jgi:two-component system, sensor histidine kinase YesM
MTQHISLKKQMQLRFSLVIVMMFFTLIASLTFYFSNVLLQNAKTYNQGLVHSVTDQVDLHLIRTLDLMTVAADNPLFSNASERAKADYAWRAMDFLQQLILDHPEIQDVILLNKAGYAVIGTGKPIDQYYNFYQQPWVYERQEQEQRAYFLDPHPENYYLFEGGDREVFSILYPLPDIVGSIILPDAAALLCNINTIELERTIADLLPLQNSRIDIIDTLDHSFFQELPPSSASDDFSLFTRTPIIIESLSSLTRWRILASVPSGEVLKNIPVLLLLSLLALLCAVCITLFTASRISRNISKPVEAMAEGMRQIGAGDYTIALHDPGATAEIAQLGADIDQMIRQITYCQQQFTNAQLFALQEQINPHFLFNTLQAIQSLTVTNEQKGIRQITSLLGEILRYSMYDPWKLVPLSDEFSFVERYLQIQLIRFPGLFTYSITCPSTCTEISIMKLLIQPVVENAIVHGFSQRDREYHLQISVTREGSGARIRITDNGCGIADAKLAAINRRLQDAQHPVYEAAIGLDNVNKRIHLKFGTTFGVQLESVEHHHTTVTLSIPAAVSLRDLIQEPWST